MNNQEKAIARILFENKVFKANGQAFQDLFTAIMSQAESDFRKIKAWGNKGDQKNDGYIESKGVYYQVYAPEDITKSYTNLISKINTDFNGLVNQWKNIKEFYFVINDKFLGVNPESEKTITELKNDFPFLKISKFYTADDLMKQLFLLDDGFIQTQIGFLPNIDNINLDITVLNEVVAYIMEQPLPINHTNITAPNWEEKIQFNNLNNYNADLLNNSSFMLGELEKYLKLKMTLADDLQKHLTQVYIDIKTEWKDVEAKNNNIFWEIVNRCTPKKGSAYQNAVLTIMAKYFESCDIFEEPK